MRAAGVRKRASWVLSLLAVLVVVGCATPPATLTGAPAAKPRLVVFFVVAGLPQWQVVGYREYLAPDGFRRFLDRGAWFANAHYAHANTQTGPGHATMLTRAAPYRPGPTAHRGRRPATGERQHCPCDPAYTYTGNKTDKPDGASPRNVAVESLGDVLRRPDSRAKVIGISGNDRGAILPAGKAG